MTYKLSFLLVLVLVAVFPTGCSEPILESCAVEGPRVRLSSDDIAASTLPAVVHVRAEALPGYAGCAGEVEPRTIREYAWDVDGDGTYERRGPDLATIPAVVQSGRVTVVRVVVTDSAGLSVFGSISLAPSAVDGG